MRSPAAVDDLQPGEGGGVGVGSEHGRAPDQQGIGGYPEDRASGSPRTAPLGSAGTRADRLARMGAAVRSVLVRAPGKINVFMRVGAPMPDGYHDVATAYQAVSLFEELRAERGHRAVASTSPARSSPGSLPVDRSNLVLRAAHLLQARSGYRGGARIHVVKRVPIAGGMGGGSADAAAALVALDALWGLGLGREELLELGAELGADVPFALTGGTAIGTGRGDRLSPALAKGPFHWVDRAQRAGAQHARSCTRALDEHRERHAADLPPAAAPAGRRGRAAGAAVGRSDGARRRRCTTTCRSPRCTCGRSSADLLELGERNGALAGIVSGSGPTIAFLAADLDAALSLQIALSAARHTVLRATGPVPRRPHRRLAHGRGPRGRRKGRPPGGGRPFLCCVRCGAGYYLPVTVSLAMPTLRSPVTASVPNVLFSSAAASSET